MPTATLEGLTLHVKDIERSIAFYSKVPGAELTLHIPGQFAMFMIGSGRLGLLQHAETKFHVEIETDDLDAMHATLVEAGLEPNGPPTTHEWGQRDFLVFDPDGNMIEFGASNR